MIEILFLGTSCMQPTKERNQSGLLIMYEKDGILIDCGEGTQRQLKIAGIKPSKITKICISHWHGDHVLGLPGLLQTLSASEYTGKLEIYGPKGIKESIELMLRLFPFESKIEYEVKEISTGIFFQNQEFILGCLPLEHSIPCVGFSFTEKDRRKIDISKIQTLEIPEGPLLGKLQRGENIIFKKKKVLADDVSKVIQGKKIAIIADTVFCNNCINLAKDADLLISEAAFDSTLKEKAEEYMHMTAEQAALVANKADAKKLVLTHFSQRYKNTQEIEEDARKYFNNIICAQDFTNIKI